MNLTPLSPPLSYNVRFLYARKIRERTKKRLLSIRLEEWQIARAKEIAGKRGISYQHLMREWISSGIRSEARRSKGKKKAAQG